MVYCNLLGWDGQWCVLGNVCVLFVWVVLVGNCLFDDFDILFVFVCEVGLFVMFDGQIGCEKYQSVVGLVFVLQWFVVVFSV